MARTYIKLYLTISILLAIILGTSSCIDEDIDDCGSSLNIKFDYSYNMLSANAFGEQVDMVTVYIFDSNGVLVKQKEITDQFNPDYTTSLDNISQGKYTLVAWAKSNQIDAEKSNFIIPELIEGSSKISDLTYHINQEQNVVSSELNNFLVGITEFTARGELSVENVTIPFKKVTNKIRVVLIDGKGNSLNIDDFDLSIVDNVGNGHINYNYDVFPNQGLTYQPYLKENVLIDPSIGISTPNTDNYAAVSEFSISRLIEANKPTLRLNKKDEQEPFMEVDIAEYLRLGMIEANAKEYTLQEYFDRQDQYTIVLYLNREQNTWGWITLIINGWIINNIEVEI